MWCKFLCPYCNKNFLAELKNDRAICPYCRKEGVVDTKDLPQTNKTEA